jgi:hypothetical protein
MTIVGVGLALACASLGCKGAKAPTQLDSDLDGVPDTVDRCPADKEDGAEPDPNDGCPKGKP